MKVRCDVCDKVEATVFCSADEAALCESRDRRVHFANKVASNHLRFFLVHTSYKEFPLCDICQERRAFLFCQEDRNILCRECDLLMHRANEHTQRQNWFLLMGLKLSVASYLPTTITTSSSSQKSNVDIDKQRSTTSMPSQILVSGEDFSSHYIEGLSATMPAYNVDANGNSYDGSVYNQSISEYEETIPGWRVDDFLDPSALATNDLYKDRSNPYI